MRIVSRYLLIVAVVGTGAFACTDSPSSEPSGTFSTQVAPVLEKRCTARVCHGVPASVPDDELDLPEESLAFRVDRDGQLTNLEAAEARARRKINTVEAPIFSSLLRKPLSPDWGGTPHKGGVNLASPDDAGFEAIKRWIQQQDRGGEDPDPPTLTDRQTFFAEEVQPRLVRRNCAAANCHGPTSFTPFRLDPGIPTDGPTPTFSVRMTRQNYKMARGFLSIDGLPTHSRLLRKGLPLQESGITHRGGNLNFFEDVTDPAAEAILKWTKKERTAAFDDHGFESSASGLLFVRGPVRPRSPLDQTTFVPGRDLYLLKPADPSGTTTNLTESLHQRPVDIRDPTVAPDASQVVFSMRRSKQKGFHLWKLDLETREAERLTTGPHRLDSGHPVANLTPVYGPGDSIYFASNRHDTRAERGERLDLDLYRLPRDGGTAERLTHTPSPELEPSLFRIAPLSGYLVFSYRRAVDRRDQTIGFSVPLDFHVDYHIYFGRTAAPDLLYQFTELPDGRSAVVAGDPDNAWAGGSLALVDRNLGTDLRDGTPPSKASLAEYAPTYRPLDAQTSATGVSTGGLYREPVALPDGSLLVAHAPSEIDLSDPDATPDYRIERLTIDEAPDDCSGTACMPQIDSREVWVDKQGVGDFDPEPVRSWLPRGDREPELDPTDSSERALYSMAAPAVNNGIMSNLAPSGPKRFRDDIAYVRFVEALPQRPDRWGPIDPPSDLPESSTDSTAGIHMPSRILGEVPVEGDGSLYVDVPPNTPFRTQFLDDERMVIGRQHNRWLYVWPGQHFTQSTRPKLYDQSCGGCHGSSSSDPTDAWRRPDATSSASLTLARYENRNPRKPRAPQKLGPDTRRTVDFQSDIQPILDDACNASGCHDSETAAGDLDLSATETSHYSVAYVNLLAEGEGSGGGMTYVDQTHGRARSSYLIEVLENRELDAPRSLQSHPEIEVSDDQIRTFVRWIETGAHFTLSHAEEANDP